MPHCSSLLACISISERPPDKFKHKSHSFTFLKTCFVSYSLLPCLAAMAWRNKCSYRTGAPVLDNCRCFYLLKLITADKWFRDTLQYSTDLITLISVVSACCLSISSLNPPPLYKVPTYYTDITLKRMKWKKSGTLFSFWFPGVLPPQLNSQWTGPATSCPS